MKKAIFYRRRGYFGTVVLGVLLTLVLNPLSVKSRGLQQQSPAAQTVNALLMTRSAIVATITAIAAPNITPTEVVTRAAVAQPELQLVNVRVQGLNIRSGPGTGYPVVGSARAGQQFAILGQSNNCAWLKVGTPDAAQNDVGWISGAAQYTSYTTACREIPAAN